MTDDIISDLTELTTAADGDLLPIVDISESTLAVKTKKITKANLVAGLGGGALTDHTHAATGSGSNGGGASLSPTALVLPVTAAPATITEGNIKWDNDDDLIAVGTGSTTAIFRPDSQWNGSSFPSSPATGRRFFRTDLGAEFYYDGSRWLSVVLYSTPVRPQISAISGGATFRAALPRSVAGTDLWIERATMSFGIESGGTALSGSHKWDASVSHNPSTSALDAGTPWGTFTIDSGSSNSIRELTPITIDVLVSQPLLLVTVFTKTGTPGNLWGAPVIEYRHVAT